MKNPKQKEAFILLITLAPLTYLAYVWNSLPTEVPMHFDTSGQPDRFGSRIELFWVTLLLPLGVYLLLAFLPKLDPKKRIKKMGSKFSSIRLIMAVFMSLIMMYIVNSGLSNELSSPHIIVALIGLLFFALGNFFKTFKPNYFMGIRTPWTLENETVWKETHELGGKMWFGGGLIIIIGAFALPLTFSMYFFLAVTIIITLIPIIFSYRRFKQLGQK